MWWFAITACLSAQVADPAYEPLARAYEALRNREYDAAITGFRAAIERAPKRAAIRKDLAYSHLKIGETEAAREQFREAMLLDPADLHVAKEYAFLCNETKQQVQARRIFDRLRRSGDAVAESAFQNIDQPLVEGIARWKGAIEVGGSNFGAHFELAGLAERRDELELAAEHYEKAWRLKPKRRNVLVDLGRVLKALNRVEGAHAVLLAASRGGDARAAESARELLPHRYPFVPEFRRALEFDPSNRELRRELGYLLLRMERRDEAETEFRFVVAQDPGDLLSATQLAFLLYARGDRAAALPLFERVMAGNNEDLGNRVRAVLRLPQVVTRRAESDSAPAADARMMAERSFKAGYLTDALKYLQVAHEADPIDFDVMLKLAWTYNLLGQDRQALPWFDLARKSGDPLIAGEALGAQRNLRRSTARVRTSAWLFPIYSSRWRDVFSYGQVKVEMRTGLRLRPYVSLRFVGDTRSSNTGISPQYYSESSLIGGLGIASTTWHGATAWFEAGSAASYLKGRMLPDYRGGVSFLKGFGTALTGEATGWFAETASDGVFVSRFGNDWLLYTQTRAGYTASLGGIRAQLQWNANFTTDTRREYWANTGETGPGVRIRAAAMPASAFFTLNVMRGAHTVNRGNPRRPNFSDLRAGFWYAFSN